jgi:translation initiation factor IF-3
MKQMSFRTNIGRDDLDRKKAQIGKFLSAGHQVKLYIRFRGREQWVPASVAKGEQLLSQIIESVQEFGKPQHEPSNNGPHLAVVLGPKKKISPP